MFGADSIVAKLFGPQILDAPSHGMSLPLFFALIALVLGTLVGFTGVVALAVYPLFFLFPQESVEFSWQSKDPQWALRLLGWYADHLKSYVESRRRT